MYPVTNALRDLFWAGYRQVARITFANAQTTITLTESDIIQGGLTIDRYSVSGDKIEVGSAVAGELNLTLNNLDGQFNDISFEGAELYVQIGLKDWEHPTILVEDALQDSSGAYLYDNLGDRLIGMLETESPITWIPCGYFIVDEPPRTLSTIKLTALDRMVKFDRTVDPSQLIFPMTVETLVNRCCSLCDVGLSGPLNTFPNSSYSITAYPSEVQNLTYRTLIQWCAALMGTCAFIRWDGLLVFTWYGSTNVTITPGVRYSSDIQEQDITITGVLFQDSDDETYRSGTDSYAVNLTGNGLIQANPQAVVNNLGAMLTGFTYRPYTAEIKSSPFLYPMDMITYIDAEGTDHASIVTHATFLMNGSTAIAGVGETAQRNGYASTGALTRQQATILANMKRFEIDLSERAQALLQMNETISNSMGLHVTSVTQLDGSTVYYYHDGVTLEDSTIIYTFRAGGFAWTNDWNDGSPTWSYGISRQGNALLNILTVYKLTADYIYGGTLTLGGQGNGNGVLMLLDSAGNEVGRMDNTGLYCENVSISGTFENEKIVNFSKYPSGYEAIPFKIDMTSISQRYYRRDKEVGSITPNHVFDTPFEGTPTYSLNDETIWPFHICGGNLLTLGLLYDSNGDEYQSLKRREAITLKTVTNSSNYDITRVDVQGQLYYNNIEVATVSSSSQRYKNSITDNLDGDNNPHKLYDLPVKQFVYNDDHPLQYADMAGQTLPGFIAEDVERVYPAAVIHNADGEVESWDERRIVPGMLALIQEQREQIAQLESRIARLEELLTEVR